MNSRRRTAVTVTAAALLGLGLSLAGCSSTTPTTSPADTASTAPDGAVSASPALFMAQATQATTAAGSARISSTSTIGGSGDQGTTIRAEGVVDFATNQAALRVSSALFGGGSDMQVILVDGKTYIQVPMFGEKWISAPMADLGVNLSDPAQGLAQLKMMADLTEIGPEPIDGVEATKYTGTLDLKDAVGQVDLPADAAKQLDKLTGTADVTVWVDDQGRIVRFDQTATMDVGTGNPVQTTSSTTISDFGVTTDITPPPADQVVDEDSLKELGDLAGSAG